MVLESAGNGLMFFKGVTGAPLTFFLVLFYHFFPFLSLYECFWYSFPLGYCIMAWVSYFTCSLNGETTGTAVRLSYFPMTLLCIFYTFRCIQKISNLPGGFSAIQKLFMRELKKETWLNLLIMISTWFFGYIFYYHSLYEDSEQNLWSGGAMWSDIAFHLNVINSFIKGTNKVLPFGQRPKSIIFAGYPLSYPLIPDYHTVSLTVSGGLTLRQAIMIPSLLISIALAVVLFCFIRKFFLGFDHSLIQWRTIVRGSKKSSISLSKTKFEQESTITSVPSHPFRSDSDSDEERKFGTNKTQSRVDAGFSTMTSTSTATATATATAKEFPYDQSDDNKQQKSIFQKQSQVSQMQEGLIPFLSVLLWLLCGGIGGWTMLWDRDLTFNNIVNEDWMQRTSSGTELFWFSTVCHVLLPQRSALFGYPLVLLSLLCVFSAIEKSQRNSEIIVSWSQKGFAFGFAGLVAGLLPMIHAHSFLCLGIVLGSYALIDFKQTFSFPSSKGEKRSDKQLQNANPQGTFTLWLRFAFFVFILAIPQMPMYFDRLLDTDSKNFLHITPIWRNTPWIQYLDPDSMVDLNFFHLWFRALGFFVPLAFLSTFLSLTRRQRLLALCFWIVFVLANVVQFQPWDKDNNKLFLVWAMVMAGLICNFLVVMWLSLAPKSYLKKTLIIFLFFSLILSGIMICTRELTLWWQFMDGEDQRFADWLASNTERDALFINNDSHIHPLTNMAGRTSLFNMAGWISSHGYPHWTNRWDDLRKMLSDGWGSLDLWKKYKIDYLVYDWRLTHDYPNLNKDFFFDNEKVSIVFNTQKYKVFNVRRLHRSE